MLENPGGKNPTKLRVQNYRNFTGLDDSPVPTMKLKPIVCFKCNNLLFN